MKQTKKLLIIAICLLLTFPATVSSAAEYKVAKNDSLYSLSKLFKTSVLSLQESNNFYIDSLTPGDKIYVPARIYKVKKGDSLHKIATKYKVPLKKLKKANASTGNTIVPGEKLILPGIKPKKSDTVISYSKGEVDLLAKLIEAEAGGETQQAKIAVGAVVINRVQSGDWAPTIKGVINQRFGQYHQFTPVKIGTINNTPSAASKRAAWTAMYGSDPSRKAIYYFDNTSTNQWLWAKPQSAQIDDLIFAK